MAQWQLNLDREDFLASYWQRKPLLIRAALDNFTAPIDANELAGLALEEEVESRIVEFNNGNWTLEHGPFEEQAFDREHPWTLLVQAVDLYIPEVAELLQLVDFIPQWRLDDVMVSYAVDGGSVGPHYDNYDVFLLQGSGRRTWKLGQLCDDQSALLPNDQLRILSKFEETQVYTLDPGDILYVPPGVAHWGIAEGECTTFSIGFRAPRINELVSRSIDALLETASSEAFYRDAGRSTTGRAGEILSSDIELAKQQVLTAIDASTDDRWFGELVTEAKYELNELQPELQLSLDEVVNEGHVVFLAAGVKLAWQNNNAGLRVFANGECFDYTEAVLPTLLLLCENRELDAIQCQNTLRCEYSTALLQQLFARGYLEHG